MGMGRMANDHCELIPAHVKPATRIRRRAADPAVCDERDDTTHHRRQFCPDSGIEGLVNDDRADATTFNNAETLTVPQGLRSRRPDRSG